MIEAVLKPLLNDMMTSTRAIRNAAMKIAVKTLCSSPDPSVTLYAWMDNHFREHIINLIDKSKQAFQILKHNKFGCILRRDNEVRSEDGELVHHMVPGGQGCVLARARMEFFTGSQVLCSIQQIENPYGKI